ncbi:hypothetical protein EX30DRAFT_397033 [Ascodesmis nigricans]|uniref:Uncharacterized protein n=1 Tax=Ascodesmis nigricans TaxID=341454 RepID=A0A4S2MQD4_9PEZI|nr:hypothetical protein EX30DRAFT_397033 [Ascodesmis nigricans]
MNDESIFHVGIWRDHSLGRVQGQRFTLTKDHGRILQAFLVLLVAFAGNRCWRLVSFILHLFSSRQYGRNLTPRHVREQQVVLNNSETAGGAFFSLLTLSIPFPTRKRKERRVYTADGDGKGWLRILLIMTALGHYLLFIALGLLTTFVDVGSTVRSSYTPSCGIWYPLGSLANRAAGSPDKLTMENFNTADIVEELRLNATRDAESYIQNCLNGVSAGAENSNTVLEGCGGLHVSALPYKVSNTSCQFPDHLCGLRDITSSIELETRNISFSALGFNSPYSKHLHFSRKTVCSPLTWGPFLYDAATLASDPLTSKMLEPSANTFQNYTSAVRGFSHSRVFAYRNTTLAYYDFGTSQTYDLYTELVQSGKEGQYCIPPLCPSPPASHLTIFTLVPNAVLFSRHLNDAFFVTDDNPVTTYLTNSSFSYSNTPLQNYYRVFRPLNSVACTELVNYCSTITNVCTGLTGSSGGPPTLPDNPITGIPYAVTTLLGPDSDIEKMVKKDPALIGMLTAVFSAIQSSSLFHVVANRGADAMLARRYLLNGIQRRIRDDAWKAEVEAWFRTAVEALHRAPVRIVRTRELARERVERVKGLEEVQWRALCRSVVMRDAGYTTFSLVGVLVVVVGAVVMVVLGAMGAGLGVCGVGGEAVRRWEGDAVGEVWWEREMLLQVVGEREAEAEAVFTPIEVRGNPGEK